MGGRLGSRDEGGDRAARRAVGPRPAGPRGSAQASDLQPDQISKWYAKGGRGGGREPTSLHSLPSLQPGTLISLPIASPYHLSAAVSPAEVKSRETRSAPLLDLLLYSTRLRYATSYQAFKAGLSMAFDLSFESCYCSLSRGTSWPRQGGSIARGLERLLAPTRRRRTSAGNPDPVGVPATQWRQPDATSRRL